MDVPKRLGGDSTTTRYAWRDLVVLVPHAADGSLDRSTDEISSYALRQPNRRIVMMVHVLPGTPLPSTAMRSQIDASRQTLSAFVRAHALWVEGAGFFASAFLAFGALLMRVGDQRVPTGLFQAQTEVHGFLRQHMATASTDAELAAAFAWMRNDTALHYGVHAASP